MFFFHSRLDRISCKKAITKLYIPYESAGVFVQIARTQSTNGRTKRVTESGYSGIATFCVFEWLHQCICIRNHLYRHHSSRRPTCLNRKCTRTKVIITVWRECVLVYPILFVLFCYSRRIYFSLFPIHFASILDLGRSIDIKKESFFFHSAEFLI